jgi:hypothetical protein
MPIFASWNSPTQKANTGKTANIVQPTQQRATTFMAFLETDPTAIIETQTKICQPKNISTPTFQSISQWLDNSQ